MNDPRTKAEAIVLLNECKRRRAIDKERIDEMMAGLEAIAKGSWNFGNYYPGLTVMAFARRVLRRASP
jgi:hypothetical protein